MFGYMERDSFLHALNPVIKLIIILVMTIVVSISFYPYLALTMILLVSLALIFLGKFSLWEILNSAKMFLLIGISFTLFMLFAKGLDGQGEYVIWIFRFSGEDFIVAFSLGLRTFFFALLSLAFVLTTDPSAMVLSLIHQLKVPFVFGYATLAAYRFLPSFRIEVEKIKFAQKIRGMNEGGPFANIKSAYKVLVPLLSSAIRKGERVSLAMEARAFGAYETRTYYRKTKITKQDYLFVIIVGLLLLALLSSFYILGLLRFQAGF